MALSQTVNENQREKRGLAIANKRSSQIKRIDDFNYEVLSQNGNGTYSISRTEDEWICGCPDHRFRGVKCKHVWAVELSLRLKDQIKRDIVIQQIAISECIFCHSPNIKKFGVRHNKSGDIQRFLCGKAFFTF